MLLLQALLLLLSAVSAFAACVALQRECCCTMNEVLLVLCKHLRVHVLTQL
jgi:hypothetical protein